MSLEGKNKRIYWLTGLFIVFLLIFLAFKDGKLTGYQIIDEYVPVEPNADGPVPVNPNPSNLIPLKVWEFAEINSRADWPVEGQIPLVKGRVTDIN